MFLPKLFRFLFRFQFFKKRYFGIYKRIILPRNLFKNKTAICKYDKDLKIKLNIEEWIQQQIYLFGYFDKPGINCIKKNLNKGDVFLDVGTNIGAYSLIASKMVGEKGSVISFEPVSSTFNALKGNVELNSIQNIQLEQKALMDRAQSIEIHIGDQSNTGTSSLFNEIQNETSTEMIEAIVFDEQFDSLNKLDFIKMDIEGAEYYALKGMKKSIQKHRPKILIEISDEVLQNTQQTPQNIIDFIVNLGYTQNSINESGETISMDNADPNYHNFLFILKEKEG